MMAECAKCLHADVCKSCDSCDGHVPGCRQFIDREVLAKEVNALRAMIEELQARLKVTHKTGQWKEWRPPRNMVLIGIDKLQCCSECSAKYVQTYRFCPNCGALMEE